MAFIIQFSDLVRGKCSELTHESIWAIYHMFHRFSYYFSEYNGTRVHKTMHYTGKNELNYCCSMYQQPDV
jgi:hypothetical protein